MCERYLSALSSWRQKLREFQEFRSCRTWEFRLPREIYAARTPELL